MVLLIHNNKEVVKVLDLKTKNAIDFTSKSIIEVCYDMASSYEDRFVIWCHKSCEAYINYESLFAITARHKMLSYGEGNYLPDQIGFVEQTPFTNVIKDVTYPTWLMSSTIGIMHSSQLIKFKGIVDDSDFSYALNSIAKLGMPIGLLCYSEPNLVIDRTVCLTFGASVGTLFKFVKQHYRLVWLFLLFVNFIIYDKKWYIVPLFSSLFYKRRNFKGGIDQEIIYQDNVKLETPSIDVIIPTIGRKSYLNDVIKDLSLQTLLPSTIIIVEQNPKRESKSELDYIYNQSWPFKIKHHYINTLGACNARNLALDDITSDFVFLADDDIRLDKHILQNAIETINDFNASAATFSCLQPGEKETVKHVVQWHTFGSASSILRTEVLKSLRFDTGFEFGYGEDTDFGMQLRKTGIDIMYFPRCQLTHLKAPVGGFRTTFVHPWHDDIIQPKPSPTVMLLYLKHYTINQIRGYKTILFIKFFKLYPRLNIFGYFRTMKKRWEQSLYWARILNQGGEYR